MLKAIAGGGGRGIRIVEDVAALPESFARASSEAQAAFGVGDLYIEELITGARHLEVQVMGDRNGDVLHLFERECSLQRRQQKLVEIAPAPGLDPALRDAMFAAALRLARAARVHTLCTFEFLVDERARRFVFMEANPRLQVEHTVTEEVMGVDLVKTQIALAAGGTLAELGLSQESLGAPRGFAVELRVNMERIQPDGSATPTGGTLTAFEPPSGAGIRVDTFGYTGYATTTSFDPLLAKIIVSVAKGSIGDAFAKGYRALCELRIAGVHTNVALLQALLLRPELRDGRFDTRFVERHLGELLASDVVHRQLSPAATAKIAEANATPSVAGPEGTTAVVAPMGGHVVALPVKDGDAVSATTTVAIVEAMKMEQAIVAGRAGIVRLLAVAKGDRVVPEQPLVFLEVSDVTGDASDTAETADRDEDFAHLAELREKKRALLDEARGDAVARYRKRATLTARERIAYLCDDGSFREIGGLIRSPKVDPAEKDAPADGIICGSAKIEGRAVMIVSQDFTVFGGSSGRLGGVKFERVARQAMQQGLPLVMLLDGGGHRIQDGQSSREYAPAMPLFHDLARMSGWVPMVSAVLGAGFASNTNYSGMADFIVMVRGQSTMGLAGPALVRAGTGEEISTEALGGAAAQVDRHGLADHATESEPAALDSLRRFLSYLPSNAREPAPAVTTWEPPAEAAEIARIVPANSRRSYDVRRIVACLADEGSVFEVKPTFARNVVTSLGRMAGRAVGFIANQPLVLSGTLDSPACEKAAHFVAMCDAFGLPLIYLMDIPGSAHRLAGGGDDARTAQRQDALRAGARHGAAHLHRPAQGVRARLPHHGRRTQLRRRRLLRLADGGDLRHVGGGLGRRRLPPRLREGARSGGAPPGADRRDPRAHQPAAGRRGLRRRRCHRARRDARADPRGARPRPRTATQRDAAEVSFHLADLSRQETAMPPRNQVPPVDRCVLRYALEKHAAETPEKVFAVFGADDSWTYAETLRLVRTTARALRKLGVKQGDHVLVWLPTGRDSLRTWFAINYLGAVYVPINTAYRGGLLEHVVENSDAQVCVIHAELAPRLAAVDRAKLEQAVILLGDPPAPIDGLRLRARRRRSTKGPTANDGEDDLPLERPDPALAHAEHRLHLGDDRSVEGRPLVVPAPVLHGRGASRCVSGRGPLPRQPAALPRRRHRPGLLVAHRAAARSRCWARSPPSKFWETIRRHRDHHAHPPWRHGRLPHEAHGESGPRHAAAAQVGLRAPPRRRRHRLRSPLPGSALDPVFNMTEVSCPLMSELNPTIAGMAGRPRPGIDARVVDENDLEVPVGQIGELIVRSDAPWTMNHGYYKNPEATARAWRNGWFHTGDGFKLDAAGNFYFVDRMKDAIRRRGENISSFEVESEVCAHPAVREAAAVAVASEVAEDELLVAISLAEGQTLDPAELVEFLRERVAHFMIPRYVRVMSDLPKTPTSKIQKHLIRTDGVTGDTWDRERAGVVVKREKLANR